MLSQVLQLLPAPPSHYTSGICALGCAAGLTLWLFGSRFSRGLFTLLLVAIGTWLGKSLVHVFGWNVSEMTPGIAGAIVFGVFAYVCHRFIASVALALVLCTLTAAFSWALASPGTDWTWPAYTTLADFATTLNAQLTPHAKEVLPFTCAAALILGFALAMFLPRLGVILLHALTGAALTLAFASLYLESTGRSLSPMLPATTPGQTALLLGGVALGALVQWKLSPKVSLPKPPPSDEPTEAMGAGQASPA